MPDTPDSKTGERHVSDLHAMREIADGLIESSEGVSLGRVADVRFVEHPDGSYSCRSIVMGPEALAGRVHNRLRRWVHRVLDSRFDYSIDIEEIEEFGPTIKLRHPASHYHVGDPEGWILNHVIRFIPGNGRPR